MFSVIAQMWTWASVSPGISVAPLQSSVVTGPGSAPTVPWRATSLMVSSSTTTAAPSTGSAPVQSITNALVKTVMLIARLFPVALPRHDLGVVHPHLLVGARRPLHRAGHAVEVVLLPEEDPRRLVVDELLQLGVGGRTALGIHHRYGAGDLLVDHLVVAVRRVGLVGQEERLDRALAVQGRPPAEEAQVTGVAVLDLVQVSPPLVDDDVRLDLEPLELGGDGERDVLVQRVAAGRRVERQLKLRGIDARLLEQRLGPRRVVLVAVDRRVVDVGRREWAAHPRRAALEPRPDQPVDLHRVTHRPAHAPVLHRAGLPVHQREIVDARGDRGTNLRATR